MIPSGTALESFILLESPRPEGELIMRGNALRMLFAGISCLASLGLTVALRADGLPHQASPAGQLGKVDFPTSCVVEVQPSLEKGLALLHSFQYTESEKTFADASTRDPKCAIAHWGKAMATYLQIWEFPNDKTLKSRRKVLKRLAATRPSLRIPRTPCTCLPTSLSDSASGRIPSSRISPRILQALMP